MFSSIKASYSVDFRQRIMLRTSVSKNKNKQKQKRKAIRRNELCLVNLKIKKRLDRVEGGRATKKFCII